MFCGLRQTLLNPILIFYWHFVLMDLKGIAESEIINMLLSQEKETMIQSIKI